MSANRKSGEAREGKSASFRRRDRDGGRRPDRSDRGGGSRKEKAFHKENPAPDEREERRPERLWIYGRHAALAAIANPKRKIKRIFATDAALEWIGEARFPLERVKPAVRVEPGAIDRMLHEGAVHQGIAVEVEELPRARLKEACQPDTTRRPVVVLDQITDPHNIGAIWRSAAAFGARAIIVQDRRTPPLAG
ncbi:MAG: TrmH family RNA methyltransferase, partial [Parvularculaceae bacterium]